MKQSNKSINAAEKTGEPTVIITKARGPMTYEAALDYILERPSVLRRSSGLSKEFMDWAIPRAPSTMLSYAPASSITMEHAEWVAKNRPRLLTLLPKDMVKVEWVIGALRRKKQENEEGTLPTATTTAICALAKENITSEVVDAYLDAGGGEVDYIPEAQRTDAVYTRLLENNPSIVTQLPKRFQTYQAYYNAVGYCWSMLAAVPKDLIDTDMVILALSKGDVRAYKDIPVKLRTAEVTLFALSRWYYAVTKMPFITVNYFLSLVPAAAKTDKVLEAAYNIMKKEKPGTYLQDYTVIGKTTDKKMNAYIAAHHPVPIAQNPVAAPGGTTFSDTDLASLYCSLYEMNLDAAEEDYLEEYEANYAPDKVLSDGEGRDAIIQHLRYLMSELHNDLGSKDELKRWFLNSGGTEALYKEIFAD